MYRLSILICLVTLVSCGGEQSETLTMWIGPQLSDCTGVAPMKCMNVRYSEDAEWELFYEKISGFDYEEGFSYQLVVERSKVKDPPADASSYSYTLVELVDKQAVKAAAAATPPVRGDLFKHNWQLDSYSIGGEFVQVDASYGLSLKLSEEEGTASGFAGCNNFTGGFTLKGTSLTFGNMAVTQKMCADEAVMQAEGAYLQVLSSIVQVSPDRSMMLTLLGAGGGSLKFRPE